MRDDRLPLQCGLVCSVAQVFDAKRLMGLKFKDVAPSDLKRWPFRVEPDVFGKARIMVSLEDEEPKAKEPQTLNPKPPANDLATTH